MGQEFYFGFWDKIFYLDVIIQKKKKKKTDMLGFYAECLTFHTVVIDPSKVKLDNS